MAEFIDRLNTLIERGSPRNQWAVKTYNIPRLKERISEVCVITPTS